MSRLSYQFGDHRSCIGITLYVVVERKMEMIIAGIYEMIDRR